MAAPGAWAVAAAVLIVVLDAVLRRAHGWAREASLGVARRAQLPPGDMGWLVVGATWAFLRAFKSGKPDAFVGSFIQRFGRTSIYRAFMFSSPTILVATPDACKQVLVDDDYYVEGWPRATLMGRKSFMNLPYDEHRRLRKLTAAPINGYDALSTYLGFIDRIVASSLRRWSEAPGEVEFLTELRRMTFKIIVHIFPSAADDATMLALERSYTDLDYGIRAMAINLPGFAASLSTGLSRVLKIQARKKLVAVLQGVLDKRRAAAAKGRSESNMDMMHRLIEAEDEHGRRLDDEEIIDILIMYLNAGHESSGHITMWATVFLQENPEIFAKAKAQQEDIMNSIPPTQKGLELRDFRKMKYLSQVIDETLRFANISFVAFREATRDVFVNGYLIPKGWKVQLWYRSVHLDPEVYPDPKKFDPSRWEGHSPEHFFLLELVPKCAPGMILKNWRFPSFSTTSSLLQEHLQEKSKKQVPV